MPCMTMIRYRPAAPLGTYVECLWYSQRDLPQLHDEYMLPCASTQLIIALHDAAYTWRGNSSGAASATWTHGIVHGPQRSYFLSGPKPAGAIAGVSFRCGAAAAVLGVPMNELTDRHIPLDDLWAGCARSLRQRLLETAEPLALLRTLERELTWRLTRPHPLHPAIALALADPVQGWGFTRIAHVQRQTGYSPKHFIALFRGAVGLTPKHYFRLKRFALALHAMAGGAATTFADLAASLGYADQPHFTREFRGFAGITPAQYRPRAPDSVMHHMAKLADVASRADAR